MTSVMRRICPESPACQDAARSNFLTEPGPLQPDHRQIERRQELRAVARRKRLRPAGDLAGAAQLMQQVAGRQRHADRVVVERLAVRRDHGGAAP